jgi:hypothetical protein
MMMIFIPQKACLAKRIGKENAKEMTSSAVTKKNPHSWSNLLINNLRISNQQGNLRNRLLKMVCLEPVQ